MQRFAVLAALTLSLAACATAGGHAAPIVGRPPIPPGVPEEYLHFADAVVGKGDVAPDFELPIATRFGDIKLSSLRGRPLVLVLGSHTCNVFARDIPALRKLYEETHENVQFLLVYVREAHACNEWVMPDNERRGLHFEQPVSHAERIAAAVDCIRDFHLEMPVVVDGLDDRVNDQYGGWPDRLYVIDADGRIAYQSGVGPFGFKPPEVRDFLRMNYGF